MNEVAVMKKSEVIYKKQGYNKREWHWVTVCEMYMFHNCFDYMAMQCMYCSSLLGPMTGQLLKES